MHYVTYLGPKNRLYVCNPFGTKHMHYVTHLGPTNTCGISDIASYCLETDHV